MVRNDTMKVCISSKTPPLARMTLGGCFPALTMPLPLHLQEAMVLPSTSVVPALARIIGHIATTNPKHKTVVFFTTARMTGYMASVFEKMTFINARGAPVKLNVVEIHSRKSQVCMCARLPTHSCNRS